MTVLSELKAADGLADVAKLLGYKTNTLSYLLYVSPSSTRYKEFDIPKRSGGSRKIHAPNEKLKGLQQRLNNLLTECIAEIKKGDEPNRQISHGFTKNFSIFSNAAMHARRKYVFNIDLENFFPSINFGRVRGFFIKDRGFSLNPNTATILAQIAIHNNELPQGSPCSPIISNLVASILDARLNKLAKTHGCRYTRYADDITFSTNIKIFPDEIASQVEGAWVVGKRLEKEIERAGYKVNSKKTRMQEKTGQQVVTGLTVNKKPNITADYYRLARSMCHSLFSSGTFLLPKNSIKVGEKETSKSLQGILAHIQHIKDKTDYREKSSKKGLPSSHTKLHRKLLNYLTFCASSSPVIVCEGKTDNVYIRCATRSLLPPPNIFYEGTGNDTREKVKLFNYTQQTQDVMLLGGGYGDIKNLVLVYDEMIESFSHKPLTHPVIIVIDNDDGAYPIFSVIKNTYGITIEHKSTADYYHICKNLYLVKTPESKKPNNWSCIEDLFDKTTLSTILDGKSFNPNQKPGETHSYGKHYFAEYVVKKNKSSINFSGFAKLLHRIQSAISSYSPPTP
jgi:retron-type reverse transcriptase